MKIREIVMLIPMVTDYKISIGVGFVAHLHSNRNYEGVGWDFKSREKSL